jgi:hypothetical protein
LGGQNALLGGLGVVQGPKVAAHVTGPFAGVLRMHCRGFERRPVVHQQFVFVPIAHVVHVMPSAAQSLAAGSLGQIKMDAQNEGLLGHFQ